MAGLAPASPRTMNNLHVIHGGRRKRPAWATLRTKAVERAFSGRWPRGGSFRCRVGCSIPAHFPLVMRGNQWDSKSAFHDRVVPG